MIALTKWLALGACISSVACTVTVGEPPPISDGFGGDAGSGGSEGGSGGNAEGGDAGEAGMGGDIGVDAGADADAGTISMMMFAAPTCESDTNDSACDQCLKQQCCDEWTACDDQLCSDEWTAIATCVTATSDLDMMSYGECVSDSVLMGIPESNTLAVLDCINEEALADAGGDDLTRCGNVCFGQDYLP